MKVKIPEENPFPFETPLPADVRTSPTIEELAQAQSVEPLADVTCLFGTWPGDTDDGFEASIRALRDASPAGGGRRRG